MLGPGRPDGVGGDDHLVGVVGGFDLQQAAGGGGREHRGGRGWGLFEVVVVVAGVPGCEGAFDRLQVRAHRAGQVGRGGGGGGVEQVARVDVGLGSGCGGGAGQRAAQMQAIADASDAIGPGLGEDLRALALIHLGSAEFWVARLEEAGRHLEQGVTLAGRIGRPYLEFTALACQASFEFVRSFALAVERGRQAAELAWRHGWTDEPAVGFASIARTFGAVLVLQGRLEEAEPWIQRAERILRAEADPASALAIRSNAALLELARGRDANALAAFQAADRLAGRLAEPNLMVL